MAAHSAGILMFKRRRDGVWVLLVHPGGPYWRSRDLGAWSIPKGELNAGEDAEQTARKEFEEELGRQASGELRSLGGFRQKGGKQVEAFALEGEFDADLATSNSFRLEWPPRSGRWQDFPEIDRAEWFTLAEARTKILPSQIVVLDRLEKLVQEE